LYFFELYDCIFFELYDCIFFELYDCIFFELYDVGVVMVLQSQEGGE